MNVPVHADQTSAGTGAGPWPFFAARGFSRPTAFDGMVGAPHNRRMEGPPPIFDRGLIDRRQRRALLGSAPVADFLLAAAVDDLIDRLTTVKRVFARAAPLPSRAPGI